MQNLTRDQLYGVNTPDIWMYAIMFFSMEINHIEHIISLSKNNQYTAHISDKR